MPFHSLAVPKDLSRQQLAAEDVVDYERRDVALTARGVVRRPAVILICRVSSPQLARIAASISERVCKA
jgi:hypothetical protein